MFPADLTSVLTGATPAQLRTWRATGVLVPEIKPKQPPLYSFRDLVALRTIVHLRGQGVPMQRVRKAFDNLSMVDLTEHPATYRFGTDGDSVFVESDADETFDLVRHPGQKLLFTMDDVLGPIEDFRGRGVSGLRNPEPHLEVRPGRVGGWPTIEGTRIQYNVIAQLVDGVTVTVDDVGDFYPSVTPAAASDAVALAERVAARRRAA